MIVRKWALLCLVWGALLVLSGCGGPGGASGRLWPEEWQRYHSGERWVLGVELSGEREIQGQRERHLRMVLCGVGEETAQVSLDGAGLKLRWTLEPGERVAVDEPLPGAGRVQLKGEGVVAGEPRLVKLSKNARTVVLVLVDTLRDDYVSQRHTPRILEALKGGRRFIDATANAPWTIPSVASLFTSRPVLEITTPDGTLVGIPEGFSTLAEAFFGSGFSTAGLVANTTVHEANGFGRGFIELEVPDPRGGEEPWDVRELVEKAQGWLRERSGEDVFLYLHLMDPHEPFRDHRQQGAKPPAMRILAHRQRAATDDERALIRRLYAGEVRRVDRFLAPFLQDLPESSTVALVADHGELLGEHDCWGHGLTLYQEVVQVPLILKSPGIEEGSEDRPVQLLDLGPTLLELAGMSIPEDMVGESLLKGGSPEPITAATFSAGPLRWAWRQGPQKVTFRMAPQSGMAPESQTRILEDQPLEIGAFLVDLSADSRERRPQDLDPDTTLEAARAFAATVGGLVPGFQLLAVGLDDPLVVRRDKDRDLQIRQVFAPGPLRSSESEGRLRIRVEETYPFALAVLSQPITASHLEDRTEKGITAGESGPPEIEQEGLFLWEVPERVVEQKGQEETIRRLRALGYLE